MCAPLFIRPSHGRASSHHLEAMVCRLFLRSSMSDRMAADRRASRVTLGRVRHVQYRPWTSALMGAGRWCTTALHPLSRVL